MRKYVVPFLLIYTLLLAISSGVHAAESESHAPDLSGHWVVKADLWGSSIFYPLELKNDAGKLTGNFGGDKLEGAVTGNSVYFLAKDEEGGSEECRATIHPLADSSSAELSGTLIFIDAANPSHPATHTFTATLAPKRSSAPPQRHDFTPTTFYRQFSALNAPVLHVQPGDTVHTTNG